MTGALIVLGFVVFIAGVALVLGGIGNIVSRLDALIHFAAKADAKHQSDVLATEAYRATRPQG